MMEEVIEMLDFNQLQWVWQVFVVVVLTLLLNLIATIVMRRLEARFSKTESFWDDALVAAARTPVNVMILVVGLSWAAGIGNRYVEMELFTDHNLYLFRRLTIIFLTMFCLVRFISIAEKRIIHNFNKAREQFGDNVDLTTLTAIAKLLRLAVIISAIMVVLPTMGIEITALLAFGGVGGIAVGFAAKDLLANFFGGLIIYLDRPFAIGDWIRSPDRDIEGVVEKIGWRITVVRTFDKRPLYVPNSVFSSIALENPSRMFHRRIFEHIGVRYRDADKIETIVARVREMLETHPDIAADQTLMVNFNRYASSSLEFFIFAFTKTTNWVEFHRVKQDVLLKVADIVLEEGAEFAFPTTTIDGLSPEMFNAVSKGDSSPINSPSSNTNTNRAADES